MTRRSQPPYPPELRERAVRMLAKVQGDYDSPWAAMNAVAEELGVGTGETVRKWVRRFHTTSRLAATGGSDHSTRTYVRTRGALALGRAGGSRGSGVEEFERQEMQKLESRHSFQTLKAQTP